MLWLKLFFSSGKGWLEESVMKHVGVIPTNIQHGKNEFYYNGDKIMIYYVPKTMQLEPIHRELVEQRPNVDSSFSRNVLDHDKNCQ